MQRERIRLIDGRVKDSHKIELRFILPDIRALGNIFNKTLKMCESPGPTIPNFTPNEVELMEAIWGQIKEIR